MHPILLTDIKIRIRLGAAFIYPISDLTPSLSEQLLQGFGQPSQVGEIAKSQNCGARGQRGKTRFTCGTCTLNPDRSFFKLSFP